jgi:hypothetical protein
VSLINLTGRHPARPRAHSSLVSPRQRWLSGAALPLGIVLALANLPRPASAQSQQPLNPVTVTPAAAPASLPFLSRFD